MHMRAGEIARLQTMTLQMGRFLAAQEQYKRGSVRHREWFCECSRGSMIRSAELARCPQCGVSRPNTVEVEKAIAEARVMVEALGEFERESERVGKLAALKAVIAKYGSRL